MSTLTLDEYERLAMRTAAGQLNAANGLLIAALGLCGESGEVADHVKKHIAQGHSLDLAKLDEEVGDVLWYAARYAVWRGVSLGTLAQANVDKLQARYPEGFTTERSVNR